jgi:hypothetical protein
MLVVSHRDTYPAEREYVHELVLGEFLGLEWSSEPRADGPVEITLAERPGRRLILADDLFATAQAEWLTPASLPAAPLMRLDMRQTPLTPTLVHSALPVIYGTAAVTLAADEAEMSLGIDIFGSIFFQLSRYEEVANAERDEHDRFPPSAQLAVRDGFVDRPLVNEYLEVLRAALLRLWPDLSTKRRSFRQRLSHDIDSPWGEPLSIPAAARAMVADVVRRHDPSLARTRLTTLAAQRRQRPQDDPYNSFDFIMDVSERHGLRSAFYFMARGTDPRFDAGYSLEHEWMQRVLKRIHERGHEIGLHPSYQTFRDPDQIAIEFQILRAACERAGVTQSAWGGRQHFLRWENPTTWRAWADAGLAYDSSLGFSQLAGFRCGVCHEYPVFDLQARRRLDLQERPLVVMEIALFGDSPARHPLGLEQLARLRERCRLFGGDFTLLWHNSRLASRLERRVYAAAVSDDEAIGRAQSAA